MECRWDVGACGVERIHPNLPTYTTPSPSLFNVLDVGWEVEMGGWTVGWWGNAILRLVKKNNGCIAAFFVLNFVNFFF